MWSACDRDFIGDIALRLTSITGDIASLVSWYHLAFLVIGDRWYSARASKIFAVMCTETRAIAEQALVHEQRLAL